MPRSIFWSSLAEEDVEKLLDYLLSNWGSSSTLNFIDLLDHNLKQLILNPKQYPLYNKKLNVRKCVLTKHNFLFYKVSRTQIVLLRIYDNRQNPESLTFV